MLIRLVIPSELGHIEDLNTSLAAVLRRHRIDESVQGDVRLIVEELACNVIEHGHHGNGAGSQELSVHITLEGDLLHLQFSDSGPPFDPLSAAEPDLDADIQERPIGGLGLFLIRQIAECVDYRREGSHNLLQVTLRIPQHGTSIP
ncbi:ATP-binding protein [Pseudomonas sp. LRF_L74]|uniref:ATP-binding protein n=1 Tax=Pseudomonas sp. LRF_L74 TaxID=3369422 RepID=UPI003F5F711F